MTAVAAAGNRSWSGRRTGQHFTSILSLFSIDDDDGDGPVLLQTVSQATAATAAMPSPPPWPGKTSSAK